MNTVKRCGKRVLALILTMMIVMLGTAQGFSTLAETYTFSTLDARDLLMYILSGQELTSPMKGHEDIDGDGKITTADVREMLQAVAAGKNEIELGEPVAANAFRLSTISDLTDSTKSRTYDVYAPYDDTYTLSCSTTTSIEVYTGSTLLASGTTSVTVALKEKIGYKIKVMTRYSNYSFELKVTAANHNVTLPYDVLDPVDVSNVSLNNPNGYVVNAVDLKYQPRQGGTYVYCNNPERIQYDAIGDALMRNENLTGEVFVTYEHSSNTSAGFYLGYQVKNTGSSDVYITITNVGYQTTGSWFGQYAWYDFYNTSFTLPDSSTYDNSQYLFYDYTPRVYQPTTYRLPAGKAFYVVGGTSSDAYRNINVDGTANKVISQSKCANAAVNFIVTGGSVTGTMYCYNRTSQVSANPAQTGYRVDNNSLGHSYGLQYQGSAPHAGVIDSYLQWTFNDEVGGGMLPVSFTNQYASSTNIASTTTPYAAYANASHSHNRIYEWHTHINPQDVHTAVGTDMVAFDCVDANGYKRTVDIYHADGTGNPSNFGNWMIEYQEHFTFINQGNKSRTIELHYGDNGALLMLPRDTKTGEVLQADFPVGGDITGINYTYYLTVPAHSVKQISMCYLLMPMSAGTVSHMVTIQ